MEQSSADRPALTKEDASLRAYQIRRRLDRLRQSASDLFQSDSVANIIHSIETEVESGKMRIRSDRQMWADLGQRYFLVHIIFYMVFYCRFTHLDFSRSIWIFFFLSRKQKPNSSINSQL